MTAVVAVAVSGGRDSIALLHATLRQAAPLEVQVHALHVHHGLMSQADAWSAHVERLCRRWRAVFDVRKLKGRPARGDSVEAWARRERYAALAEMARAAGATLVLLAHHRRDQAETFVLQALRGAGPAGLAAMPRVFERDGMAWARPWLDQPRQAIEAYVRRHRLPFVDDPSNEAARFARSRLRRHVWPALAAAFPDAETSLAAAARRAHQASEALAELARDDIARIADADALRLDLWADLSAPRRALALREWLRRQLGRGAPDALVDRLVDELPGHAPGRWPLGEGVELHRYRGRLTLSGAMAMGPTPSSVALSIRRAGRVPVPSFGGALQVKRVKQGGVALARLGACELRPRVGAERFQAGPGRPPRSLKKQFQAAAVSPWQREAPLLYAGDTLVFVPGLGIDARVLAPQGEQQVAFEWVRA